MQPLWKQVAQHAPIYPHIPGNLQFYVCDIKPQGNKLVVLDDAISILQDFAKNDAIPILLDTVIWKSPPIKTRQRRQFPQLLANYRKVKEDKKCLRRKPSPSLY